MFLGEAGEGVEDGAGGPRGLRLLPPRAFELVGEKRVGEAEEVGDGIDDEEGEVGDGGEGGVEAVQWGGLRAED